MPWLTLCQPCEERGRVILHSLHTALLLQKGGTLLTYSNGPPCCTLIHDDGIRDALFGMCVKVPDLTMRHLPSSIFKTE